MKLVLKSLDLKNFRSVESAKLEFDANGMVLLQGHSGAGKSTLNLAIAYVLGFCPIPQGQLQRWGSEKMSVSLEFMLDGEKVWVHRGTDFAGMSGPGDYSAIHGAKSVNSRLQTLLKVSPDMLGALTYRPQQEPGAFIRKTDAEKKEFLTQILRLDKFEQAVETGNAQIKKLESEIDLASRDVEHLTRAKADAEAALVEPPSKDEVESAERTIVETKARILESKTRLKELEGLNPEAAKKKALYDEANKHLDKAIADDERRMTDHARETRAARDSLVELRAKAAKAEAVWTKLQLLVSQRDKLKTGTCPTCGQETLANDPLAKLDSEIGALDAKLATVQLSPGEQARFPSLEQASTAQFVPSPTIEKLRKIASRFFSEMQVAQEQNKAFVQQLKREEFEGQKTIDQLAKYLTAARQAVALSEKSIATLAAKTKDLDQATGRVGELRRKLAAEQDFVALVGNQGFLGAIFEEVLQDISLDANEILGRVPNTCNVTIEFKTESVTQKGSIKRSIIPVVSVGGNIGPFDAVLSGGMKTMVMLAVDLAVSKVIARRAGIQPGWLILDEPFDGAGSPDREAMLELLAKESAERLVLIVDHSVDSKGLFSKSIQVSMSDGVTSLS